MVLYIIACNNGFANLSSNAPTTCLQRSLFCNLGHGEDGDLVAQYTMSEVHNRLEKHQSFKTDLARSFHEIFTSVNEDLKYRDEIEAIPGVKDDRQNCCWLWRRLCWSCSRGWGPAATANRRPFTSTFTMLALPCKIIHKASLDFASPGLVVIVSALQAKHL